MNRTARNTATVLAAITRVGLARPIALRGSTGLSGAAIDSAITDLLADGKITEIRGEYRPVLGFSTVMGRTP